MRKVSILFALSGLCLLASCGGNAPSESSSEPQYDPRSYHKIIEKRVPFYQPVANPDQTIGFSKLGTEQIYKIDDSSIPYVDLDSYFKEFMSLSASTQGRYPDWSVSYGEGGEDTATIFNGANGSKLVIDFDARTATYENFDIFFNLQGGYVTDYFVGCVFGGMLDQATTTYDFTYGTIEQTIDFGAYNFDCYIAPNGNCLLPYNLARILTNNYALTSSALYANDAFYGYYYAPVESDILLNELIREQAGDWLDDAYMQYDYDSLALYLDNFFGLDEHQSRVEDGKTIHYLEQGAYAALAPYKERLKSTKADEANDALLEFFAKEVDDGGHAMYCATDLLGTKTFDRISISGPETVNTLSTIDRIQEARAKKGTNIASQFPEEVKSPNGYYKEYNGGTTAYIQFDGFTGGTGTYDPASITADNYYADSITLFYYANEQIQNNPNIKDVVLDLSANGGGVMFASEYISSWVSGGSEGTLRNVKTNSCMNYRVEADVNLDGKFNDLDYLDEDINVYVMISNGSFSCGNKLPCNIEDNREANTYFIGSRTGGGSCAVSAGSFNVLGGTPRLSGNLQIGRKGSTQDHFVSVESGVYPDQGFEIPNTDYDSFADIDDIMAKILANRK